MSVKHQVIGSNPVTPSNYNMNSKTKGDITEAKFITIFLSKGWSVSLPFGDNQRYDMIVDDGIRLLKVQCKTGRISNGCILFSTQSINSHNQTRYSYKGQIDYFAIYCVSNDASYFVSVDDVPFGEGRLRIDSYKKNTSNKKTPIRWASTYII